MEYKAFIDQAKLIAGASKVAANAASLVVMDAPTMDNKLKSRKAYDTQLEAEKQTKIAQVEVHVAKKYGLKHGVYQESGKFVKYIMGHIQNKTHIPNNV